MISLARLHQFATQRSTFRLTPGQPVLFHFGLSVLLQFGLPPGTVIMRERGVSES